MKLKFSVPTLFGLEGIAADELRRLGVENVAAENGRVLFSGSLEDAARANLWLRTGERVQIHLGEFRADSFDALFDGVRALRLEELIPRDGAFPVKGHSVRSKLTSIPACQKIIKKAAAERLGEAYGLTVMPETGVLHQLSFNIINDWCSLMLDTSGPPLYKRGYREETNLAPIRETLAAGMVLVTRRRGDRPLVDPLCGSGTILIEAALLASNRAPGLDRRFALEVFGAFDRNVMKRLRGEAREAITDFEGEITGSDVDGAVIEIARRNAERAGMSGKIRFENMPLSAAPLPDSGILITNPPYGERMGETEEARTLYKELGKRVREAHIASFIISPDEQFEKHFGRRADKKRKLYNGMIKCDMYQFKPF